MAARKPRNTISIIIPNVSTDFFGNYVDLITNHFQTHGYQVQIGLTAGNIEWEKTYMKSFSRTSDAILIFSTAIRYAEIAEAVPKHIPVIFLLNQPQDCPHTCIVESDYSAIYQGIISCSNHHATKVACVCDNRELSSNKECLRAYRDAMNISLGGFDEKLVFDLSETEELNPAKLLAHCRENHCQAIFATSSSLTTNLLDYLIYYNSNPDNKPVILLGYSIINVPISMQMYIDVIQRPLTELVKLAYQQTMYIMKHPQQKGRVYRLKGTLHMHRYNGWTASLPNEF